MNNADRLALIEHNLVVAKESLNDLIENDVADLLGLPHTDEGRAAAMAAMLRVNQTEREIFGDPE